MRRGTANFDYNGELLDTEYTFISTRKDAKSGSSLYPKLVYIKNKATTNHNNPKKIVVFPMHSNTEIHDDFNFWLEAIVGNFEEATESCLNLCLSIQRVLGDGESSKEAGSTLNKACIAGAIAAAKTIGYTIHITNFTDKYDCSIMTITTTKDAGSFPAYACINIGGEDAWLN